MSQPSWQFVANIGDVHPFDYGGLFVYRDATGVYSPEAVRIEPISEEDDSALQVHRVCLDRCKVVDGYLVPYSYEAATYTHPLHRYEEWFAKDLDKIADCMGTDRATLVDELCSDDPIKLASAYRAILDYHGWDNGDSYPDTMTREECEKRYGKDVEQ